MTNTAIAWPPPEQLNGSNNPNSLKQFFLEYRILHLLDVHRTISDRDQHFLDLTDIDNLVRNISGDINPQHRLLPLYCIAPMLNEQGIGANPIVTNAVGTTFTLLFAAYHRGEYWITVTTRKRGAALALTDHYTIAALREKIGALRIPFHQWVSETFWALLKRPTHAPF